MSSREKTNQYFRNLLITIEKQRPGYINYLGEGKIEE